MSQKTRREIAEEQGDEKPKEPAVVINVARKDAKPVLDIPQEFIDGPLVDGKRYRMKQYGPRSFELVPEDE